MADPRRLEETGPDEVKPEAAAGETALELVRRLAQVRVRGPRCELCGDAIPSEAPPGAGASASSHEHVLALARREIRCVCSGCAVARPAEWLRVRRRVVRLPELTLADEQWESLGIPIRVAFFVTSRATGETRACYPSPAGLTESTLPLDSWKEIVAANPVLASLEPDVETLLVHRLSSARDHYVVSLDLAFRLAGLVRRSWRGFTGGREVVRELTGYFAGLAQEAQSAPAAA